MQFDGGSGGVDTRPAQAEQTFYYPIESASPAGWWERERQPTALWLLLGVAAALGIILAVAVVALNSSGDTTAGAGGSGDEAAIGGTPASPAAEGEEAGAGAEALFSEPADAADANGTANADDTVNPDGTVNPDDPADAGATAAPAATGATAEGQRETLAVIARPDGANTTPSAPAETSTTAVETTVTTAPPTTEATTTQPPATEAPTTEASTTQPPATEAPTTQAPDTEPPTTPAPGTEATTTTVATAAPTTTATTMPPATEAPTTQPPTTQAPPPTAAEPAGNDAVAQQQVLDLTNAERAKAGCSALRLDQTLNRVADGHSEDMAARDYFSHNDPEGNGPGVRIDAAGYQGRGWGENIAAGYRSAAAVVEGWMNSDGHRRNILNCNFNELGVGYAEGGSYGVYWTQVFGTR